MKLEITNLGMVDGNHVVDELLRWRDELDGGIVDTIIYETIDTVLDILIEASSI